MNTPNKITLSRILLIPLVIFFYLATFIPYGKLVAALIFAIACFTDFLDGMIARKTNQVTDLGKFFDAIADKVLIMTGMILVVAFPVAGAEAIVKPLWFGIVCIILMLAREFIISALRQIAASKGVVLAADKGGKVKALFQDITITLYLFYAFIIAEIYPKTNVSQGWATANTVISIFLMVMLAVSTVLTITSGISYIARNTKVFAEKKEDNFTAKPEMVEEVKEEVVVSETISEEVEEKKPATRKPKTTTAKKSTATKKTSGAKKTTAKKPSTAKKNTTKKTTKTNK